MKLQHPLLYPQTTSIALVPILQNLEALNHEAGCFEGRVKAPKEILAWGLRGGMLIFCSRRLESVGGDYLLQDWS